ILISYTIDVDKESSIFTKDFNNENKYPLTPFVKPRISIDKNIPLPEKYKELLYNDRESIPSYSQVQEKIYIDPEVFNTDKYVRAYNGKIRLFIKYSVYRAVSEIRKLALEHGGHLLKVYNEISYALVDVPPENLKPFIQAIKKIDGVEAIVADRLLYQSNIDSMEYIGATELRSPSPLIEYLPHGLQPLITAPSAGPITFPGINGSGITVAVLDTGIDPNHPDFFFPNGTSKIVYGWNYVDGNDNITDLIGHGTHVAATIAGSGQAEIVSHSGLYVWHVGGRWRPSAYWYPTFNPTTLVYEFNLTELGAGDTVKLDFWSLTSFTNYWNYLYGYPYSSAYVEISFDGANWMLLDDLSQSGDPLSPVWEHFNYTIYVGSNETLYVAFIYYPTIIVLDRGWFLDDIALINVSNSAVLVNDTLETAVPAGVETYPDPGWHVVDGVFEGVAPAAKLWIGKVCGFSGCPTSAIINAMYDAAFWGVDVISMSLGGSALPFYYDPLSAAADDIVSSYGVVVVAAAGNSGDSGFYTVETPGIARKAICAGATQKPGLGYGIDIIYFSGRGPSLADFSVKPDVVAPGVAIISAKPTYFTTNYMWDFDDYYTIMSGTSMATPHVSGAVALIKQAHPDWSPEMIKAALMSSATFLDNRWGVSSSLGTYPATVFEQGGGFINVSKAVNAEAIPLPASLSFGILPINSSKKLNFIVINTTPIASLSPDPVILRHLVVENLDGDQVVVDTDTPLNVSFSMSIVRINSSAWNVTVTITLGPNAKIGLYDGIISFTTDTGYEFHVVMGWLTPGLRIRGYVKDIYGNPVAGATVAAANASSVQITTVGTIFNNNITTNVSGADGYYELIAPLKNVSPISVEAYINGYYHHRSPVFLVTGESWMEYNITLVNRTALDPKYRVLIVYDDLYAQEGWLINYTLVNQLDGCCNIQLFKWYISLYGLVTFDVLNDFNATLWISGTNYYPVDYPQYIDLWIYTWLRNMTMPRNGGLVMEGEDIGWYHVEVLGKSVLLEGVLKAEYNSDDAASTGIFKVLDHYIAKGLSDYIPFVSLPPYPDDISPIDGGFALYNYTALWANTSIVVYDGYPSLGDAVHGYRSVYIAFPVAALPYNESLRLLKQALGFVLDTKPPTRPPVIFADAEMLPGDEMNLTITVTGAQDDFCITYYDVYLNGTLVASLEPPNTSFSIKVDRKPWNITVVAIDFGGYTARSETMIYPQTEPEIAGSLNVSVIDPGSYSIYSGATGTFVGVEAIGAANIIVLKNSSLTPWGDGWFHAMASYAYYNANYDVKVLAASNITSLVVKFYIPDTGDPEDYTVLWNKNGLWYEIPASNRVVGRDSYGRYIMVIFTASSTPSLSDLSGTPIWVLGRIYAVGGAIDETTIAPQPILGIIGLAIIIAAVPLVNILRKKK
ncbi:MAG: S8 family serine peptidase, partial [Desulfurococcales archaeon]|nr:S8 family serine peptidase [Desulfurococcales archaeon]